MSDEQYSLDAFIIVIALFMTVACVIVVFVNAYESGAWLWAIGGGVLVGAGSRWKWDSWMRALVYGGIAAFVFSALSAAAMLWPILVFEILSLCIVMWRKPLRDLVLG